MSGFVSRNLFHIKCNTREHHPKTASMKRNRNDNKSVLDLCVGGKMLLEIGAKEEKLKVVLIFVLQTEKY